MKDILPGDYIAGFVDGEGCFYLTYRSERKSARENQPVYRRWVPYFAIVLRQDDKEILEKIKITLGCGTISLTSSQARYNVQNIKDIISKVIPFFEKHTLRAKKKNDFLLWKKAAFLIAQNMYNNRNYGPNQHKVLLEIREEMRQYKSQMHREYKNKPNTE